MRPAIIARRDDLGSVTPFWQQLQTYATHLETELRWPTPVAC